MTDALNPTRNADAIFDRDFLETRGKVLELAAALDRLDRAPGGRPHEGHDPRMGQLLRALEALLAPGPDRAETIQLIFSDHYDPDWQAKYLAKPRPLGPQSRSRRRWWIQTDRPDNRYKVYSRISRAPARDELALCKVFGISSVLGLIGPADVDSAIGAWGARC